MLEIQKFLIQNSLDDLQTELGIKSANHPFLPLVILNYDQIDSPKTHPIVREARGLVLDSRDWSLVARSFPRFFNWGEVPDEMSSFDFSQFHVHSKEDGSLVIIYNFEGEWHANTRGSFGLDNLQFQSFSWREGFCKALNINQLSDLNSRLDPDITYVCEFVSPWNKIVRHYQAPQMFLLAAFDSLKELPACEVDSMTHQIFARPQRFDFSNINEIKSFLSDQESVDPTFEGVIICDKNFQRWKIKNPSYLSLHKIRGEGDNLYHPRHLLSFVLKNDDDELLTYFPEVKDQYFKLKNEVEILFNHLQDIWSQFKDLESQKEFAISIKDKTPLSSILFSLRKQFGSEPTTDQFRNCFRAAETAILRQITKSSNLSVG